MQRRVTVAIRTRRLSLILRTGSRFPDQETPASRITGLAGRNWCRYPPGRLRWILDIVAPIRVTSDLASLAAAIRDQVLHLGTMATVVEALSFMVDAELDDGVLAPLLARLRAGPIPLPSRARLWLAKHQIGLGLTPGIYRQIHPPC